MDEIKKLIYANKPTVCVIGIGRIGLPTALSFAKAGLSTIGLDINQKLIDAINSNKFPLKDEPGYEKIFDDVMNKKLLTVTTNTQDAISKSDILLLSLPTPMDDSNIPNYEALKKVGKDLNKYLSLDSIVIVESTVEPGFIENELTQIIEGNDGRLRANENFGIGVCPETANPGEILKDFTSLPRLVAALDEKTAQVIMVLYEYVFGVDLIKMSNCKTANAVKLTTNVFRDVNIAFINELSILFEKIGVDTMEVLNAARTKHNFQIHYPSVGVGGPCLPVNSYQFLNTAKFDEKLLRMIKIGRKINEHMPQHTADLLLDGLSKVDKTPANSTVLILGISYKPNVKDVQLSPAQPFIQILCDLGVKIKIYDPYFKNTTVFGIRTESDLDTALNHIDAVVLVTFHDEFSCLEPSTFVKKMIRPVFVDSKGILDIDAAKKAGIIYRGLGRGTN
ncbi:MAG: UDP-glucose/GDP-mannose dehydrogenase [Cenarchaeum symbiont of Oopsacas minuta]|nr:UDP-glucose/GDP-mannose dehydrogenase [Cenarchaeum symbiont of Oopsacas minuta]